MYSVMWSEHCSYKSSKVHLRRFGELPDETPIGKTLAGIGENAGVIDIGQGYAVTFKIESHNHPSYVEPYQGAATGVGGIVRDILAMGARPIAVMDPLRFGPLDAPDTARVLPGVVAGVGGYGNCLGLPNIGGEVVFDRTYAGNPLVNALCVGVLRHEDLHLAKATGVGNQVILYGAATGGDGIGGVSVLASETFEPSTADRAAKRPSVQVGDPFMEKLLIECTLELFAAGLVAGIQDLGGAGLSCATSELASAGDGGMHVDLDRVPLRDSTLSPEEILMSESQERMMAVVEPRHVEEFLAICAKWDVLAVVDRRGDRRRPADHRLARRDHRRRAAADRRPRGPGVRAAARPARLARTRCKRTTSSSLARPSTGDELAETAAAAGRLARTCATSPGSPTSTTATSAATRCWPSPRTPACCASTRTPTSASPWPPTATAGSRTSIRTPGAQLALAEAYRNVAAAGAQPVAITDCLNFGSPEDPGVMWQFRRGDRRTGRRLPDARPAGDRRQRQLLQPDRRDRDPADPGGRHARRDRRRDRRVPIGFAAPGEEIYLLGETRDELDGSAWADVVHGHLGGRAAGGRS